MKTSQILLVMALSAGLYSTSASAQQPKQSNSVSTKTEAAAQAKQAVNGRVLKVDQQSSKFRVKVLKKSGRVVTVDVNKSNKKMSKSKDQDNDHG